MLFMFMRNNFQITTNFPGILGIFQDIKKNLHCIVSFFSEDAVAYGDLWLNVPIVQQYCFWACFARVDKQSPISRIMFTPQFGH